MTKQMDSSEIIALNRRDFVYNVELEMKQKNKKQQKKLIN